MSFDSPLPVPEVLEDEEAAPYWEGAREGRLVLPRCDRCSTVIWYPRRFCPACGSLSVSWFEASGAGNIYSFTVIRQAPGDYAGAIPFLVAYVELAEGPRVLANLVGYDSEPAIGEPVTAVFDHDAEGAGLLRFQRVPG